MTEFELINEFFNFPQQLSSNVIRGIGDDCALVQLKPKQQLVISSDSFVSQIHFFSDTDPADIAYKALAVNVSDLAAMGAKPLAFTLAISLPEIDSPWLKRFSHGLQEACQLFSINLIGGDTTKGALSITVTVFGKVKKKKVLFRDKAQLGDDIWVTGHLGAGRAGLALHGKKELNFEQQQLWQQLIRPQIPHRFAAKLASYANAAIDISDGLLADLGHIIVQSKLGAKINVELLPMLEALIVEQGLERARQSALIGGDDYQLCFTAPAKNREKLYQLATKKNIQISRIGEIIDNGLQVLLEEEPFSITENGWQHFAS